MSQNPQTKKNEYDYLCDTINSLETSTQLNLLGVKGVMEQNFPTILQKQDIFNPIYAGVQKVYLQVCNEVKSLQPGRSNVVGILEQLYTIKKNNEVLGSLGSFYGHEKEQNFFMDNDSF